MRAEQWLHAQAKAAVRAATKEGDKWSKAAKDRDARVATLVQEKNRLRDESEQRLSEVHTRLVLPFPRIQSPHPS